MRKLSLQCMGLAVLLMAGASAWAQSSAGYGQQMAATHIPAKSYTISTADFPGADGTQVVDVANGVLVGNFFDPLNSEVPTAFTMKANVAQQLTIPGFNETIALFAISTTGEMVGQASSSPFDAHSLSIIGGQAAVFSPPQAILDQATGVNASGTIVGIYFDGSGAYGYSYSSGQFTTIAYPGSSSTAATDINKSGEIVGYYSVPGGFSGFLLKSGNYTSIVMPQATTTKPSGINDKGEIAGSYIDASFVTHGFLYSNGVFQIVDVPGASETFITRVMNNGELVGSYLDDQGEIHAFTAH